MSFKINDYQHMTLDDSFINLTSRERKALENSWVQIFADEIFPVIDEELFSVLYSDRASRPNAPVNVIIGALIIKELFDYLDDEIVENLMLNLHLQYALSQRYMTSDEFSNYAKLRNGVETVQSYIRKNYHHEKLPRGKQRGKFFLGSKIAALNFRKLFGSRKGLGNYALNPVLA